MENNHRIILIRQKAFFPSNIAMTICALLNSNGGVIDLKVMNDIPFDYIITRINVKLRISLWAFSISTNEQMVNYEFINKVIADCVIIKDVGDSIIIEVNNKNNYEFYKDFYFCIRRRLRVPISKELNIDDGSKKSDEYVDEYYFRIKERSIKTEKKYLPYYDKVLKYDLPYIKDYESMGPTRKDFSKAKEENNVIFKVFGELPLGHLYKYMDLESALRCLDRKDVNGKEKNPNIRFVEPTNWDDQYEGRFYTAGYKLDEGNGNRHDVSNEDAPFLYAGCFSSKPENEAAWVLYSHNKTGLASRCVEFTLNKMKFREELVKNLRNCSIYIGAVQYMNKERIDKIDESKVGDDDHPNLDYYKYFNPFMRECYINLLLLKRPAFEHEKEVRIFIVPNDEVGTTKTRRGKDGKFPENVRPKSMFVDIDWTEIIEKVRIDENCTEYEFSLLQNRLDDLAKEKKRRDKLTKKNYEALLAKLKYEKFNPYKDEKLKDGPITIVTNQKE